MGWGGSNCAQQATSHKSVQKIKQQREGLGPIKGLKDNYRELFHTLG